jgi:hypothetical protein
LARTAPPAWGRLLGLHSAKESEIDRAVAQLINRSTFKHAGVCPYVVVTSHLLAGLTIGPEAFRARSAGQLRVDPVVEIKGALKHIGTVLYAAGLTREDIAAIGNDGDQWKALRAVLTAEHALENASALFRQIPVKTSRPAGGRTGALHIQAMTRAMANAWRVLTGRLPAKDNLKFHGLLLAAVATIFGHPAKEPDWESATKTAVKRIKKDAASRG